MHDHRSPLYRKVHGYLVGAAVGDAFGIRTELMHYKDIEAQYGRVTHFEPLPERKPSREPLLERFNAFIPGVGTAGPTDFDPLGRWGAEEGVYTDDTRYRLMTCRAIVRKRGPITGADLADEWWNYRMMAEGAGEHVPTLSWTGPQKLWARMMASLPGLTEMAHAQRPCIDGWDGPLGLIHAGDPERAAATGSSMAVAIATALLPGATIDQVVAGVLEHAFSLGLERGFFFAPRLRRLLEIARDCKDVFELREPFYREFLVTFPPFDLVFSLEMVPCALALCTIADGDFEQAVIGAANMGRDADSIGTMTGEIMGALHGVDAIPAEWTQRVTRLNPEPDLAQLASELCDVIVEGAERQRERAIAVLSMR